MKVLIATPLYPPQIGGPAKYAQALSEWLPNVGHEAPVLSYGWVERHLPSGVRHLWYFLRLLPQVFGVDAVFALDTWSVGLPALIAAKLARKKFLVRVGGDFLWEQYVERTGEMVKLSEFYKKPHKFTRKEKFIFAGTKFLARRADILLFNSSWQIGLWQEPYALTLAHCRVLENYYPRERAISKALGRVFVSAGREIRLKNTATLRRAFAEVKKRHPDIVLDTTVLPQREHHERIQDAYAVIISSLSDINPNGAIEAIGLGKPFIVPQDSGVYERLKGVGLFVDTTDARALERAIEELLDKEEYRRHVAAIVRFSYAHSWEEIAREIAIAVKEI